MLGGLKQTLCPLGPRNWARTVLHCPLEVQVSSDLQQEQGLRVQQTWVWHKPSWRRSPLSLPQSHQNLHKTGKQTLGGHTHTHKTCVHQDPEERTGDPTRAWPKLACEYPGVSSEGIDQLWPAAGSWALSTAVHIWDLLKKVTIIFITSTILWLSVKQQGGNTALPIRTRSSFPLSQSIPSGRFHKPVILIYQMEDRMKTTITKN